MHPTPFKLIKKPDFYREETGLFYDTILTENLRR